MSHRAANFNGDGTCHVGSHLAGKAFLIPVDFAKVHVKHEHHVFAGTPCVLFVHVQRRRPQCEPVPSLHRDPWKLVNAIKINLVFAFEPAP